MSKARYLEESNGQEELDGLGSSKEYRYRSLKDDRVSPEDSVPDISNGSSLSSGLNFSLSCMKPKKTEISKVLTPTANVQDSKKVPDAKLKRNQSFQVPYSGGGRFQNVVYQSLPRSVISEKSKSLPSSARSTGLKISCLDSKSSDLDSPVSSELGDDSPFTRSVDILSVPVEDVASELTLLDLEYFRRIQPEELNSCSWTNKNKHQTAPNIVAFTGRFNFVSFWIVEEILNHSDPKGRAEVISYFIRVAKKLNDLSNLHSQFAALSALKSEAIYRLKQTWRHVPKKDLQLYEKLFDLFDTADNFSKLRQLMDSLKLPCIPYLGFFLTDLIHIDTAHPKSGDWSRGNRQLKMDNVLRVIASYQESDYSFLRSKPKIHGYLRSVRYIEEFQKFLEDDHFKKSVNLEPPVPHSASKESLPRSTPNTPGDSPCKGSRKICGSAFVPGHRKSKSLGSKFRSASLPRNPARPRQSFQVRRSHIFKSTSNQRNARNYSFDHPDKSEDTESSLASNRHLIDDSLMGDNLSSAPDSFGSHCPSPDSDVFLKMSERSRSLDSLDDYNIPPIPEVSPVIAEGCLRRKTVRKRGKSPNTPFWQSFWVQLRNRQLLLFPQKGLSIRSPSERHHFREEGFKVLLLSDWLVSGDDLKHPEGLILTNKRTGDIYKYRAGDTATARDWLYKLTSASQVFQSIPLPIDLIKFE